MSSAIGRPSDVVTQGSLAARQERGRGNIFRHRVSPFSQWAMDGPLTAPILRQAKAHVNRLTRMVWRAFRSVYGGHKPRPSKVPAYG